MTTNNTNAPGNSDDRRPLSRSPLSGKKRLAMPWIPIAMAAGLVVLIILSGLRETGNGNGTNSNDSGNPKIAKSNGSQAIPEEPGLQVAAAIADVPTETTVTSTSTATGTGTAITVIPISTATTALASGTPSPMGTATSTTTSTAQPDATEIPVITVPPGTAFARPSRTRVPTVTGIPTSVMTQIAATQVVHATNVAYNQQAIQTSVALTHAPTITPGEPPAYPSATPIMGILPGCGNTRSNGPQAYSCWRGVSGGQIVEVYTGREGRDGDRLQGLLWVRFPGQAQADEIYPTPSRVGAVRIVSVDGARFTLETVSQQTPQVFVFDLHTRQWVSP